MRSGTKIFVLFFCIAFSCRKDPSPSPSPPSVTPTACFTPSSAFLNTGDTLKLIHCAKDYDRLHWQFGDGQHADGENPKHLYAQKGTYQVTLSASNGTNIANYASTVRYGLSANITFTFSFSNWQLPSHWTWPHVKARASLYLYPDTLKPIQIWDYDYKSATNSPSFVTNVSIPATPGKYHIATWFHIAGLNSTDSSNISEVLGTIYSVPFDVSEAPVANKKVVKLVTLHCTASPLIYN
jgi:hypothetical protein